MSFNIAIDGPAGAGKSTIAKKLAKELGYVYVDTGAMYRAMAYFFWKHQIHAEDEAAIAAGCKDVEITITYEDGVQNIWLNGENVSDVIRREEVGKMASVTSIYPAVRTKLVELQQALAKTTDVIMDGRDIGTVVLPEADVKIYMTANPAIRAKRRYEELMAKGISCNLEEIQKDIMERDFRDMNREISPLKKADDAIELDTSDLDIEGVVNAMKAIVEKVR